MADTANELSSYCSPAWIVLLSTRATKKLSFAILALSVAGCATLTEGMTELERCVYTRSWSGHVYAILR